ncbi:MAG: sigma-70 family RNA polymerase sigma factor [Deltaproteobacteria bacterium]|nr:sigma-70 family RNA polymerase sigma factor [Kofleriaceae bacterium]
MDDDALERVVSSLEDDAFRRGGSITHDRLLALASKNQLSAEAIVLVRQCLLARDVSIEGADRSDDDEGSSDVVGVADITTENEEEPGAEALAEVRDILKAFYEDASKYKLLTSNEEIALARRIRTGLAARERLKEGAADDVARELKTLADDGDAARTELVQANLLLVPHVAKEVGTRGALTQEDLIQEGNLGLLRAADRFNGDHGTRFSTYACWWIWSFMKRAANDHGRLVRIPVHILDRIPMLLRTRRALALERGGGDVSVHELAEHLSWRVETVQFVLQALEAPPISMDSRADDDAAPLAERLAAPPENRPDTATVHREQRGIIDALVASLGEKLAFIVRERFGLANGIPRTLEDIGEQMGVTRERVRQLEVKAFEKLRHPSRMKLVLELLGVERRRASEEFQEDGDDDE